MERAGSVSDGATGHDKMTGPVCPVAYASISWRARHCLDSSAFHFNIIKICCKYVKYILKYSSKSY